MLTLLSFPAGFGEPSASSYCVKAMCLLNMAALDWHTEIVTDARKMPMGKLPVLREGARLIADTDRIRDHLQAEYMVDLDAGLTDRDRAVARAFTRMVDEHLYFALVHERWASDDAFQAVKEMFFSTLPLVARAVVPGMVRRTVLRRLHAQGIGRFSEGERLTRIRHDLDAIETTLGSRRFLLSDVPCSADAAVAPVLSAIGGGPGTGPLKSEMARRPALQAYVSRIRSALYPDATGLAAAGTPSSEPGSHPAPAAHAA